MAAISHMTAILMMNSDIRHRYVSQIIGNQTLTKNKWLTVNCIILLKQLEKGEKHGWFSFMYINTYDVNYSPHQPHATRYQCSNSEMAATTDTPCVSTVDARCRLRQTTIVYSSFGRKQRETSAAFQYYSGYDATSSQSRVCQSNTHYCLQLWILFVDRKWLENDNNDEHWTMNRPTDIHQNKTVV